MTKQLTILAGFLLMALVTTVEASALGLQGVGTINRCPGMSPRVLNVESLSAALSGKSPSGRRYDWVPGGTPYDLRLFAEQAIVDFNFAEFHYDGSFTKAIDPYALAAEKLNVAGTVLTACLKNYDIANIRQTMAEGTKTTIDLGYLIFATTGLGEKRRTVLVQELAGRIAVHTGHFFFFINTARNGHQLIRETWAPTQSQTGDALKTVPNAEADQGMAYMRGEISDFFSVEKTNEGVK